MYAASLKYTFSEAGFHIECPSALRLIRAALYIHAVKSLSPFMCHCNANQRARGLVKTHPSFWCQQLEAGGQRYVSGTYCDRYVFEKKNTRYSVENMSIIFWTFQTCLLMDAQTNCFHSPPRNWHINQICGLKTEASSRLWHKDVIESCYSSWKDYPLYQLSCSISHLPLCWL